MENSIATNDLDVTNDIEQPEGAPAAQTSNLKKWLPLGVIASILGVAWYSGWFEYFSLSSIIMHREALTAFVAENYVLGIGAYLALYVFLVAISFPGASLLTIAAGFLFGGIFGGLLTVFAATAGAVIIFLIARSSFGSTLEKRAGPFVKKLKAGFQQDSFLYLLTIRLTPFPFWVMNIVPALLDMKVVPYAIATFIGIIPGTIAYSYIGAGLGSVIAAQEKANPGCAQLGTCSIDPSALITSEIVIAISALAVVSFIPVIIKKIKGKPAQS